MPETNFPRRIAFLTHEPFYPPSGGGSAEAIYLVEEMRRRNWEVHIFCPQIADAENISKKFGVHLHQFTKWRIDRYTRLRNFKYLTYPFFLERMVLKAARGIKFDLLLSQHAISAVAAGKAARGIKFDLLLSQHAISAVAAGKLKRKLKIPVVMNFLDMLTGFMETWPRYIAPRPLVGALKRYELSLPSRYAVDGVLTVSDTLADCFSQAGFPREKILPIYYGYDAKNFPFRNQLTPKEPAIIVMHGSFDAHHIGKIALGAMRFVTRNRPGTIFRFIGKRTASLEGLLNAAQKKVPGFKFEAIGFVPYADISKYLADASVGIVPYEESIGTHCAFVAKAVEYIASGLPTVCTPLKSIQTYFKDDPMVKFSKFDGEDFGKKIISWLDEAPNTWQLAAATSAARVQTELDWRPLCRRAVDFVEKIYLTTETQRRREK